MAQTPQYLSRSKLVDFLQHLEQLAVKTIPQRALEVSLITGVPLSIVKRLRWGNIDLDLGQWTIPAAALKSEQPLVISLPTMALASLKYLRGVYAPRYCGLVFATQGGQTISKETLDDEAEKMGLPNASVLSATAAYFMNTQLVTQPYSDPMHVKALGFVPRPQVLSIWHGLLGSLSATSPITKK